ncbi:rhodanese-like domain-containing protein [Sedimenticola sp.]|uniref:rhodanese-like domain-containing protein n=1 Tax=Sedimenticola sp. TaxID=1940285 RepID=UPI002583CBCB|nr:rhodanese-like domain-containing protein [Sedimenticola sp.]MCW8904115.1 rhodanese-like domain-containing protein [Sedimenticola sp.]
MNLINKGLAALLFLLPTLGWAVPAFLVDSEWLAERIDEENLIVLEARYHPHRHYTVGHIPGAINVVGLEGTGGQKWKSGEELAALYRDIPKDKRQSTHTATTVSA